MTGSTGGNNKRERARTSGNEREQMSSTRRTLASRLVQPGLSESKRRGEVGGFRRQSEVWLRSFRSVHLHDFTRIIWGTPSSSV